MIIEASAPGRAGIVGNPADGYGGSVISCTTEECAHVALAPSKKCVVTISGKTKTFSKRSDYALSGNYFDPFRAICRFLKRYNLKVRIRAWTDIPVQAGLAGSTALLASLLTAILKYLKSDWTKYYLAEMLRIIELHYLRIQCGYQDQYMTIFGGINYMDFREKEHYRVLEEEIFATIEPLAAFIDELPMVLIHTGVKRVSGVILKPIRQRWLEGDKLVIDGYNHIGELARRGKRALIEKDWPSLAELMNENHEIQKSLGASGVHNDRLIDAAMRNGALAAKLAGAGGGGTIIVLTDNPEKIIRACKRAGASRILFPKPSPGVTVTVK